MRYSTEIEILSHVFEHHCSYDELLLPSKQRELFDKLQVEGFHKDTIAKAFVWFSSFAHHQKKKKSHPQKNSIRLFSADEINKIGDENLQFIRTLEHVGVVDATMREFIINQLMRLEHNKIAILDVKWVTFLLLSGSIYGKQKDIGERIELFSLVMSDDHHC
jgi:Smg protein